MLVQRCEARPALAGMIYSLIRLAADLTSPGLVLTPLPS